MNTGTLSKPYRITPAVLLPGTHLAVWSGYEIRIGEVRIKTEKGVRGWTECLVHVEADGALSVLPNVKVRDAASDSRPLDTSRADS